MYGVRGARPSLTLCTGLKFPLLRIEASFKQSDLIPRAGTIQQVVNGVKSEKQIIPFENRYYVFPTDLVPYSLFWSPIASLPSGYLQVWEYVGELSQSILNQFIAYSNGDSMSLYSPPASAVSPPSTIATSVSIPSANSGVVLIAANPNRKGLMIHNSSNAKLYVSLNPDYDAVAFAFPIEPFATFTMEERYTGKIMGQWATVDGRALVTEFT